MGVRKNDLGWLEDAAMSLGMYPGCHWDLCPSRFAALEKHGYVYLYIPHNPVHKEYAAITDKGRELLAFMRARLSSPQ